MKHILLVDDEENIRFSFSSILSDVGYQVVKIEHFDEAEAVLRSHQFDVAIVDRLLGAFNGMDLVRRINQTQPFCATILMSAFPNFQSASEGFQNNLFAYLQKPIKRKELCNVVDAAVKKSFQRRKTEEDEQQLIQAQKMSTMGLLAGGIVHDFNSLLMTINGWVDLALTEISSDNPLITNFQEIQNVSRQGEILLKDLLSYMRPTNDMLEIISAHQLFKTSMTILRTTVPKKVKILESMEIENTLVQVHQTQIHQVLLNLGINAVHAMENNNAVLKVHLDRISLFETTKEQMNISSSDCIRISVEDNGCGMDTETMQKIFTPFFSTRPKGVGTGIGLSVSKKILESHGGGIAAESLPGEGSTFFVYLPAY